MPVIATAGHVDHGKSALVLALTGTDPDRLREEKERGLTIDLGFAVLPAGEGEPIGIVDVPGHERFIKNMLAGVGGIDAVILVVAADEGIKPQTLEHLAILDLLAVERGVVALTKVDLVDAAGRETVESAVRRVLSGKSLDGAPIVGCSVVTGAGVEELRATIERLVREAPAPRDIDQPRLSIDRAFTISGFGTVVTGTLLDGALHAGEELKALPDGPTVRVRGLQHHGLTVETASPGRRTAVNVSGAAVDALKRGMVLVRPGSLRPSSTIDVRLRATPDADVSVRHNSAVSLHIGASETEAKLLLLDADRVDSGESAWAQLRIAGEIVALPGDHFIVRDPNATVGGGTIVDVHATRHRRFHEPTLVALGARAGGSPEQRVIVALDKLGLCDAPAVAQEAGLSSDEARQAIAQLASAGTVKALAGAGGEFVCGSQVFRALTSGAVAAVEKYHASFPSRRAMPLEQLRTELQLSTAQFGAISAELHNSGLLRVEGSLVALPSHKARLSPQQAAEAQAYLASLAASPFRSAPADPKTRTIAQYLEAAGEVFKLADRTLIAAETYEKFLQQITEYLASNDGLSLAGARDLLGTNRRQAQMFLEFLDARRITRRLGDLRVLRDPQEKGK